MDDSDEVDIDFPALLTNELLPATIAPKSTDTETNTDIYHPTYLVIVSYLIVEDNSIGLFGRWP